MAYFDSWRIDFEAMKQETSGNPMETVFIDTERKPVDINLRKNQVKQEPLFE